MNTKTLLLVFVAIECAFAAHLMVRRDANQAADTNSLQQFFSNTWDTLRNRLNSNSSQSRIRQIQSNLTEWRQNFMNASGDVAQDVMARLQNLTQGFNNMLRERASNDSSLVKRLYNMVTNSPSGQNDTLRHALRTAAQTMAENYSGLANSSIQLANDVMNRGRDLFNEARIRAGNDTNKAVKAANTAIDAIRNSSQPINQTLQAVAANLAQTAQRLSAGVRTLMEQTSSAAESGVQTVTSDEFKQRAQQSLEKLSNNMSKLRDNLSQVANNAATTIQNNMENNEVNVIDTVSSSLTREYDALQNQLAQLRRQTNTSS